MILPILSLLAAASPPPKTGLGQYRVQSCVDANVATADLGSRGGYLISLEHGSASDCAELAQSLAAIPSTVTVRFESPAAEVASALVTLLGPRRYQVKLAGEHTLIYAIDGPQLLDTVIDTRELGSEASAVDVLRFIVHKLSDQPGLQVQLDESLSVEPQPYYFQPLLQTEVPLPSAPVSARELVATALGSSGFSYRWLMDPLTDGAYKLTVEPADPHAAYRVPAR